MKIHPSNIPLFVYGTLRSDRKYSSDVAQFCPKPLKAYAFGKLFYIDFKDEEANKCVTVALDPVGSQRIRGELLDFRESELNHALALFDEKEFNFYDLSADKNLKRERVFIRTLISCHNEQGETILAWSYINVAKDIRPSLLVNSDTKFGVDVDFKEISYEEYLELKKKRVQI